MDPVAIILVGAFVLLVAAILFGFRRDRYLESPAPNDKGEPSEGATRCVRCGRATSVTEPTCSSCGTPVEHGIRSRGY
jgi:uncharacterized paraquat-inducible protein A